MASAELSADEVFKACGEAIDFLKERRGGSSPVVDDAAGEKTLKNLRALAACCVAEGSDAKVTVSAEEAFWLVDWFKKAKDGDRGE